MHSKQANQGFLCQTLFRTDKGNLTLERRLEFRFTTLKGQKVQIRLISNKTFQNTNLYVSGLPKFLVKEDIDKYFSQYGKIISIRQLTCKETGLSRGVAFVRFDTRFEADHAVRAANRSIICAGHEPITVKVLLIFFTSFITKDRIYSIFATLYYSLTGSHNQH